MQENTLCLSWRLRFSCAFLDCSLAPGLVLCALVSRLTSREWLCPLLVQSKVIEGHYTSSFARIECFQLYSVSFHPRPAHFDMSCSSSPPLGLPAVVPMVPSLPVVFSPPLRVLHSGQCLPVETLS